MRFSIIIPTLNESKNITSCIKSVIENTKLEVSKKDIEIINLNKRLKILEDNPINTSTGEITEKYMHTLEQIIIEKPEDYLWSHKRWKRKKPK